MALRRQGKASLVEAAAGDPVSSDAWDGLPTVAASLVVIRAARAGELLATPAEPLQLA